MIVWEIKKFLRNKNIMRNIYRIQAYNLTMYGYLSVWFINCMLKGKSLLNYTNLFSPIVYGKNDKITIFLITNKMKKLCCVICGKYKIWKT